MTELARWQARFAITLAHRAPGEEALLDLTSSVPGPSPAEGIAVYRGNTRACRIRALQDVYPVCRRVLGAACFDAITADYVALVPSRQFDLNQEGAEFPAHLARLVCEHANLASLPWLSDLAELERECHRVYYLPDDAAVAAEEISADADPELLFPLVSQSILWLTTAWPVHQVWETHRHDDPPPVHMEHQPSRYVIQRRRFRGEPIPVSADLVALLDACHRGLSVAEIANRSDLPVERLGELSGRGWLTGLTTTGADLINRPAAKSR